jgi:outer membrane protein
MRKSTFLLFLILQFFITNISFSEDKIVFVNMTKILNMSKAGQSLVTDLDTLKKKNIKDLKQQEEKLKNDEKIIISQKNILNKTEFEKKLSVLRADVKKYNIYRKDTSDILSKKKLNATNNLMNSIRPILFEYSELNSISIILEKKHILVGKNSINITNDILKIVDQKIKKISIK